MLRKIYNLQCSFSPYDHYYHEFRSNCLCFDDLKPRLCGYMVSACVCLLGLILCNLCSSCVDSSFGWILVDLGGSLVDPGGSWWLVGGSCVDLEGILRGSCLISGSWWILVDRGGH